MEKDYQCYFEFTLDIIGGKWKPLILYHIDKHGVIRYGELRREITKINERMLTRQLRELEKWDLVNRKVFQQVPPKVEYSLTETGKSVMPIMFDLRDWGKTYNKKYKVYDFHGE